MNEESYPFTLSRTEYRYEFVSISKEKEVKKIVLLSQTDTDNIYNLALLDLLEGGELSDISESNNNDMRIVMATVIQILVDFTNKAPKCFIAFRGSDERRQRLYRIIIARELTILSKKFRVFGRTKGNIQPFEANKFYDFYLIERI